MFRFLQKPITLVTHSGGYHADDVFACATVQLWLDRQNKRYTVTRTRDRDTIAGADFVFDVGDTYEPENHRYDHHQSGGAGKRSNGIEYAAFGLVWKHLGKDLCNNDTVFDRIDAKLAMPIDAIDNGISIAHPIFDNTRAYSIGDYFSAKQPSWNEDFDIDAEFLSCVATAKEIIRREIERGLSIEQANAIISDTYTSTDDKRVLIFDEPVPTNDIFSSMPEVLYIVRPRTDRTGWSVRAIKKSSDTFDNRKDLPASWAGKRDAEFAEITGIPEATFCHRGRFMCVATTKQAALALAKQALDA